MRMEVSHIAVVIVLFAGVAVLAQQPGDPLAKIAPARRFAEMYKSRLEREQDAFAAEVRALQKKYGRSMEALHSAHVAEMKALQDQQTREGDLDGAIAIRVYLEQLQRPTPHIGQDGDAKSVAIPDAPAGFTVIGAQAVAMENGAKAFTNRDYTLLNVPARLAGWGFYRLDGGGRNPVALEISRPGRLFIAVDDKSLYPDWRDEGAGFNYTDRGRTRLTILSKPVEAGAMELPRSKWAVLILTPGK